MRLLFLSNLYPPYDLGGFEQLCQEVTVQLLQKGHIVKVLTSRYGNELVIDHSGNVVDRSLHLQANIHHYRPIDFFLKRSMQEQADKRELRRTIDQFSPDLIVVWGMWNLSRNLAHWAEKWMPGRVAYYVASYWPNDLDIHEAYWRLPANRPVTELLKSPLRALALFQLRREGYPPSLGFEQTMCCSQYVRDTLVQAGKLPANAGVLYVGIIPEPFLRNPTMSSEIQESPLRLLYFGSLLPHKGVHTAIEAMFVLKQRKLVKRVELTILGGGHPDYEKRLRKMVTKYGIDDRVHFVGRLPRDEIPSRVRRFDVFLFTSIWPEPFGRTIIEAMVSGLVVIGSDVGGSREIFEHYNKELLFQPEDSRGLADRIIKVMGNRGLRQYLVQIGRQMVLERFTLDQMVDNIEDWLRGVAK